MKMALKECIETSSEDAMINFLRQKSEARNSVLQLTSLLHT
jgi:hypothetical protein